MLHKTQVIVLCCLVASSMCLARGTQVLSLGGISNLKKDPCAFFHVWATWCAICVKELPEVLNHLGKNKILRPVVVDVSSKAVQDGFSKKWLLTLNPPFVTYLKPAGDDAGYLDKIDDGWSGALPYFGLFSRGKLVKRWVGEQELVQLFGETERLCKRLQKEAVASKGVSTQR